MKQIIEEKCELLEQFGITTTEGIEREMSKRTNEIQLDNYCHDLIKNHLNKGKEI